MVFATAEMISQITADWAIQRLSRGCMWPSSHLLNITVSPLIGHLDLKIDSIFHLINHGKDFPEE